MSGIASVSPVVVTAVAAYSGPAAPKARPSRPETALQEAMEPLSETKAEAQAGDQQAIRKLAAMTAFTMSAPPRQAAGHIDLRA